MTINPGTGTGVEGSTDSPPLSQDTVARLARAYMATYRGPHGDAPGADSAVTGPVDRTAGRMMSPALVDAHLRLGRQRTFGDTRVAVYGEDDPAGFGPALQIVTDNASMADGLRHRAAAPAGGGLQGHHESGVPDAAGGRAVNCWQSSRRPTPRSVTASMRHGSTSNWPNRSTPRRWRRSGGCCPACSPTPARWRWTRRRWRPRWSAWRQNSTPTSGAGSQDRTARMSPRCCAGWPTVTSCCWLSTLPGPRRPVLGRSVQSLGGPSAAHRRASAG